MRPKIDIIEFAEKYAPDFARLNYEWIERYFEVEKHDREILDDPERWVIEPGGQIFFAVVDGEAAGTVALIPAGADILELTKMAVSPRFQGRGIADQLMDRCVEYARASGARLIFLESHSKLGPALSLYKKHGFQLVPGDPNSLYARADVRMELRIGREST